MFMNPPVHAAASLGPTPPGRAIASVKGYRRQTGGTAGGSFACYELTNPYFMKVCKHHSVDGLTTVGYFVHFSARVAALALMLPKR